MAETVKRYGANSPYSSTLVERADGYYVAFDDYAALRAENERLRRALEWYLADDMRSVEDCTLESVDKRPAWEALAGEKANDAFADLPRLPSVEIPIIGTLGPDGQVTFRGEKGKANANGNL